MILFCLPPNQQRKWSRSVVSDSLWPHGHQAPLSMGLLEWVAIFFSRESSWPRDRTQISRIVDRPFNRLSHQGSQSAVLCYNSVWFYSWICLYVFIWFLWCVCLCLHQYPIFFYYSFASDVHVCLSTLVFIIILTSWPLFNDRFRIEKKSIVFTSGILLPSFLFGENLTYDILPLSEFIHWGLLYFLSVNFYFFQKSFLSSGLINL